MSTERSKTRGWSIPLGVAFIGLWLFGERSLLGVGQNHELGFGILMAFVLGVFLGPILIFRGPRGLGILLLLLGLFEAVTVPSKLLAGYQADLSLCKSHLKQIATAVERYQLDSDGEPLSSANFEAALIPNYMEKMPKCPAAAGPNYQMEFGEKPEDFVVKCKGEHHSALERPADHPQYNLVDGLVER